MNRNEIELNGEIFSFIEISPNDMITGSDELYFFTGISWKQLDTKPRFEYLETVKMYGQQMYVAELAETLSERKFYWNATWYKLSYQE